MSEPEPEGVWGKVDRNTILGYTASGMPVTSNYQALHLMQKTVPFGNQIRKVVFDNLESIANRNDEGWFYNAGPAIFNTLGAMAKEYFRRVDRYDEIGLQYPDAMGNFPADSIPPNLYAMDIDDLVTLYAGLGTRIGKIIIDKERKSKEFPGTFARDIEWFIRVEEQYQKQGYMPVQTIEPFISRADPDQPDILKNLLRQEPLSLTAVYLLGPQLRRKYIEKEL